MALKDKLIEKEIDNQMAAIKWNDVVAIFNGFTDAEKLDFISDINNGNDKIRQLFFKKIRQSIRDVVTPQIDGYITSGNIPVSFLKNLL